MVPACFTLSNGIRVVHAMDPHAETTHCAFVINAGSRDEGEGEHGAAHLIEHCLFKGTEKRSAHSIMTRLDAVGGEINAYTTKEETWVYASALRSQFQRAAELLFDVVFHSTFPEPELEKEKRVVCDEIASYRDNPDEMLSEEFDEKFFPGQSMGRSILGTKKSVKAQSSEALRAFMERTYNTNHIVFAVIGNVGAAQVKHFVSKYLEAVPIRTGTTSARVRPVSAHFEYVKKMRVHQVHTALGAPCPALHDDRRTVMMLLNNILGGPALNSRLNLRIRERYGFCYFVESAYHALSDFGTFQVYFGTDRHHFHQTLGLVRNELDRLAQHPLSERALEQSKMQIMAQMALGMESPHNRLTSLARSMLHFGRIESYEEVCDEVRSVSAADIQSLAATVFQPDRLSMLAYSNA